MAEETLAQRVRKKYPGVYDDLDDATLERQVRAKYPGVYDDLPSSAPREGSALQRFAENYGAQVNPWTLAKGLYHAIETPQAVTRTLEGIWEETKAQGRQAVQSAREGYYPDAAAHVIGMIPLVGPAAVAAGQQAAEGDVAGGLGTGAGLVTAAVVPHAVPKMAGRVAAGPRIAAANPAEAAAVQFGLREGVPVDVATATGSRFLRGTQRLAEESLLGSRIAERARQAQGEAMTATGQRLAARTSPTATTPELAGQALRDRMTATAAAYDAAADAAYTKLRALEQQQAASIQRLGGHQAPATHARPYTTVPMAVDVAPTKAALRPIYEALSREAELVPLMGDKARALTALDRLMRAPDLAPLSVADSALGELKTLARVDQAFRRTTGQGIAAEAVGNLDQAVRAAAQQAGPEAFRALMDGRAATVNKFKTIELLDSVKAEPVKAFRDATLANDAGIARLRALARAAPNEVRQIGRAWLEEALRTATAEGSFSHAQRLLGDWQKLGPQTKQLLFRDPAHIQALDNFFLLAKKLAENPNPSGTALTLFKGGELTALGRELTLGAPGLGVGYTLTAPVIAKLLLSPTTTRLLVEGLQLPARSPRATAAWATRLRRTVPQLGVLLDQQAQRMAPPGAAPPVAAPAGTQGEAR